MARRSTDNSVFWKKVFNCVAFISIALIGFALMISYLFRKSDNGLSGPLLDIASILAYVVVAFYSLFYAINKPRGSSLIVHMVIWSISVVLVFVFVILRLV